MNFKQLIKIFESQPKKLFLIDGSGALLSAFLLGVVLVKLERIFGIPPSTLYLLAAIPVVFMIYDFYGYRKENNKIGVLLKGIAIMNLLYCCLSVAFAIYHHQVIKLSGWLYILIEVIIVISLAILELRVSNKLRKNLH